MSIYSDRILALIARKMGAAASEEELEELEDLLSRYPEYHFLIETLMGIKGNELHIEKSINHQELISDGWEHLSGKLDKDAERRGLEEERTVPLMMIMGVAFHRNWPKWAAVFLGAAILVGGIMIIPFRKEKNVAELHQVITPYGGTSKMTLPDGTRVWMNAGTRLEYPNVFQHSNREVYLEGEAYFDVKENADHPFIVHAGSISIKVLGTAFNVKAYSNDKNIETTLLRGKIEVHMNDDPENKILLSPHEKLTVINTEHTKKPPVLRLRKQNELKYQVQELAQNSKDSSFVAETAWVENNLAFVNESFLDVAQKMERWYNVNIQFENSRLKAERFSGVFEKEDIQQALQILQMTTDFKYKIEGKKVYLFK